MRKKAVLITSGVCALSPVAVMASEGGAEMQIAL